MTADRHPGKEIRRVVENAQKGDKIAFDYLYIAYFNPIYRYIFLRSGGRRADAEDLTQEVFLRAWRAVDRFEIEGGSFLAWLYVIARNACFDFTKKKKAIIPSEAEEFWDSIPGKESASVLAEQAEHKRSAWRLLESLSDDQREVMILRYIEDLNNREIAIITGKSEEAIRQLQSRAIRGLREKNSEINQV
jgi:RNA polymerase sigma-70 factor, ECF subfamily